MIITVSIENAHLYGDILPSIYRLRYRGFKQRQNYDVPEYKGMEYDAYDTPATTYLAWRDDNQIVRGCARLFPTSRPYMIEDLWPDLIQSIDKPKCDNVWEASRLCIDKDLPLALRRKIHGEILCALQEFGALNGIEWMLGVMTPLIWRAVFINSGWPIDFLGSKNLGGREQISAGRMNISESILSNLRKTFDVQGSVLAHSHAYDVSGQSIAA
ncbi:acyl-homoserine-lactone synthase [Micavibrio aeruginosavorus]|nr:acyl-homoserine-lactone synthase [Micavibrio aeruginosavorus]